MVYIIPAAIILVAAAIGALLQFVVHRRVLKSPAVRTRPWLEMVLQAVGLGYVFWMAALGAYIAIQLSSRTAPISRSLDDLVLVLVLLSVTIVAARFTGAAMLQLSRGPEQQIASGTLFEPTSSSYPIKSLRKPCSRTIAFPSQRSRRA